jgi:hypothetical protein
MTNIFASYKNIFVAHTIYIFNIFYILKYISIVHDFFPCALNIFVMFINIFALRKYFCNVHKYCFQHTKISFSCTNNIYFCIKRNMFNQKIFSQLKINTFSLNNFFPVI